MKRVGAGLQSRRSHARFEGARLQSCRKRASKLLRALAPAARLFAAATAVVLACAALPCAAQTLADVLRAAQVPSSGFSVTELAQTIDGIHAVNGQFTWVTYVRIGKDDGISGPPVVVRYDARTGSLQRREMPAGESEFCCGPPLDFFFTRSYALLEYHNTPSASTTLVVDPALRLTEILYGFNFREVVSDQVVFIENMVHFAPQHPERLRLVNLRTGETRELYPLKGDQLRAAFIRLNGRHMPPQHECQVADDPCDPSLFDEDVEFLSAGPCSFRIRVTRQADYRGAAASSIDEVPLEAVTYTYQFKSSQWLYCEQELLAPTLVKLQNPNVPDAIPARCNPTVPAVADAKAGQTGPFPAIIRKEK